VASWRTTAVTFVIFGHVDRSCYLLDRCKLWPLVANRHICISQLLSSCCYLFTVSNSGLLSAQRPRPASPAHFRHSHIPELICGVNSSIDLECRSEMCCRWLAENTGRKNHQKIRHLRTIAQICRAISSQLRHVSTVGKKF